MLRVILSVVFLISFSACKSTENRSSLQILGGLPIKPEDRLGKSSVFILSFPASGGQPKSDCSGSLIHRQIVLTAGHCAPTKNEMIVLKFGSRLENPILLESPKFAVHPDNVASTDGLHTDGEVDLSMIYLEKPVSAKFIPIKLPEDNLEVRPNLRTDSSVDKNPTRVSILGYGKSGDYRAQVLRSAEVEVFLAKEGSFTFIDKIAGGPGDSGGMVVLNTAENDSVLVGVLSGGSYGRIDFKNSEGESIYSTVAMDLRKHLGWINSTAKSWQINLKVAN